MKKTLYRSTTNKMICGVCGGVSEYLEADVSIVRIVWGVLALTGFGLAAYIVAALVMPVQ